MAQVLTQMLIDSLKPKGTEYEVSDAQCPGLRIRIQPTGIMSWTLRGRFNGRQLNHRIGACPGTTLREARKLALKAKALVADGVDPSAARKAGRAAQKAAKAEKAAPPDLISDLARTFAKMHAEAKDLRPRTASEIARLLQHDVLPVWGKKRLSEITPRDAVALTDSIVAKGKPILANRVVGVLKVFGKWAHRRGYIETNPFADLIKPAAERSRDRVLDDREIAALLKAIRSEDYPYGPLIEMLLLTGARRSEIAAMAWSEVNLEAKTWTLPKERSKNRIEHVLPLPDAAISILKALPHVNGSSFCFTTNGRNAAGGFERVKPRIDRAMSAALGEPVKAWTLHDLRRSCASGMASLAIQPHIVEAVLNHKSGTIRGVASVYNRYSYQDEQLNALKAWAAKVREIETGVERPANVVALRG